MPQRQLLHAITSRMRWAWWAGLLVLLAGATLIVRLDLAQRRAAFLSEARATLVQLNQATARLDAILATLTLLTQPDQGDREADATGRLPALYPQVQAAWRRQVPGGTWPTAAAAAGVPIASLVRAEAASSALPAATRHPVLAVFDAASSRYALVLAGSSASFALLIDARQLLAPTQWPWASGDAIRVQLRHGEQAITLRDDRTPSPQPLGLTRGFTLNEPLASASQAFDFQARRMAGPTQWPWGWLAVWAVLCLGATALIDRNQRLRAERLRSAELERLARTARLGTLGELAAGLAHELNQPLTAALSASQSALRLLREEPLDEASQHSAQQALTLASSQVRRAADVVARLRRQLQPGDAALVARPVDLAPIARRLGTLLAPDLAASATALHIEGQAPSALGDATAIEQILHNLITNALRALGRSSTGTRRITVHLSSAGSTVCCAVCDNGPGVPAQDLPHLFEPFFTTHEGGLGLGLPLCQTLALALGGQLRYRAAPGGGSQFELELPAAPALSTTSSTPP